MESPSIVRRRDRVSEWRRSPCRCPVARRQGLRKQLLLWESAGPDLSLGVLADMHTCVPCCELVLTGMDLDTEVLGVHLDRCLVTDAELVEGLRSGPDPFYDALGDPAITADVPPG